MTDSTTTPPPPIPAPDAPRCANCQTPLLGDTCYRCGQPVKGLVRPLTSILGDFLDTVLSIDSRLPKTLTPLYFRPGFLSNEYFAGRRVPYVTPLRLYFFLSVFAFLVFAFLLPALKPGEGGIHIGNDRGAEKLSRMTPDERALRLSEVDKAISWLPQSERDKVRADLEAEIAEAEKIQAARAAREAKKAAKAAKAAAAKANAGPDAAPDAAPEPPSPLPPPAPPGAPERDDDGEHFSFNGHPWDEKKNPVSFAWLTDSMNASLNSEIGALLRKARGIDKDPGPFVKQMFSVAPQALFVMLPLFALLLKIFYVFKRRLYMEHLIVALHSHSFICLSMLVIVGASKLAGLNAGIPVLSTLTKLAFALSCIWVPLYLLLMQKRVYGQGWILTTLKFGTLGIIYTVLLCFAMMLTMLVSLVLL